MKHPPEILDSLQQRIQEPGETFHAPHLLDLEVTQVLRRKLMRGETDLFAARQALDNLVAFRLFRYPHAPNLGRIWELRNNLTAYDASYIALSEALDAPLLTLDRKLATASGHHARVEVF